MSSEQILVLEGLGVNMSETMERFMGNETLYFKCLRKFVENKDFDMLLEKIAEKNVTDAFEYSHGLKGVVGNLGFSILFKEISVLTDVFRAGSLDYSETNFNKVKDEYARVISHLETII